MSVRVLHVINTLGPGGAESVLYRLVTHVPDVEHEVICLFEREWYSPLFESRGIKVHHLNIGSLASGVTGAARLNRLIRKSGADVIQCWMYRSNFLGGIAGRLAGVPVIWNIRCSSLGPLRLGSRFLAYACGILARWIPDYVINCSARSADLHAPLGYARAPGGVIANGYDPDVLFPDEQSRASVRKSLGIGDATFAIASIARWHKQKDIPTLLRAVRLAFESGVPLKCLLVGHELDSDNPELIKAIEDEGCTDFVLPLGRRADVRDLARGMDLHVLASCGGEGFSNAVAETLLSGTPNAVTDVGDSAMMVGDTGWVVRPEDPEQLAQAIVDAYREWSERPERWQVRCAAARRRVLENFSLDRMADAYQSIWRDVVSQRPSIDQSSRAVAGAPSSQKIS